ncbi:MAG: cisplatin damage response ATP-dependent DNA ligase [Alphaproteobacteria bacterium]|nr:cisplatin damage response ATP-dependent DNA ligase [Alphaproteobacteria bacterium]
MNRFARLLDDLVLCPARGGKLRLLHDYLASTPDPDRGWALAALTGGLDFRHAKPAAIRALVETRVDPVLFALSYDYVGDLAETTALIWPAPVQAAPATLGLGEIVDTLAGASRAAVPALLAGWLDRLDEDGRWALLKLVTGGLRVGAAGRLAKTALARLGGVELDRIEEFWHAQRAPYRELFAWLTAGAPPPSLDGRAAFRPLMLAHPLEPIDRVAQDSGRFAAEWKWDGIRVQLVGTGDGSLRLFSRTGDDIGAAFPEFAGAAGFAAVLDGELLAGTPDRVAGFADLQQRLNRKSPGRAQIERHPAFLRLYDILFDGDDDLRTLDFVHRRRRLETWHRDHVAGQARARWLDLSPLLPAAADWDELERLRDQAEARGAEGLMLKRLDAPYVAGRIKGLWFKWKREPRRVDAVLMYAQRGHGRRSSFYSDFTFGCWRADGELVPVGKAYFGFTDDDLARLDKWVRAHSIGRFGPVREVEKALVCELAFDAVQRSTRHKSGVALRFPRIGRIRWDKPAAEADRLETLERMIDVAE